MVEAIGLLIALVAWMVVMRAIAWSWNKHASVIADGGLHVAESDQHMTVARIARRHTVGWTLALLGFFVLLGLAEFPLWQQLALAGILAVVYGTSSIKRGESEWAGKDEPDRVALFGRIRDAIWYRVLAASEWAAYLVGLVFVGSLLVSIFD
jgi:hypothetical protein